VLKNQNKSLADFEDISTRRCGCEMMHCQLPSVSFLGSAKFEYTRGAANPAL